MTIKHRIEQLEKNRPPDLNAIDDWLAQYAEPFESDEEREEIFKIFEQIDQEILAAEKLRQKDGERLDAVTTGKAGQADPAMATVEEVDGAED